MFWTIVLAIILVAALPSIIMLLVSWVCILLWKIVDGVWTRYENHKVIAKHMAYRITCIVWWILMYLIIKNYH